MTPRCGSVAMKMKVQTLATTRACDFFVRVVVWAATDALLVMA